MGIKKAIILFLFFIPLALYSQEAAGENTGRYIIRTIDFEIDGRTKPFALSNNTDLREGEIIQGRAGLEKYIEDRVQSLTNQRVLEKASIDYTLGEAGEDGLIPVDLLVHATDTHNVIAIPWVQFDSNSGLEISVKFRDYNFLGTMSPLRVDLGYKNNDGHHTAFTGIDSDTPFKVFGYNWVFNFDNDLQYTYQEPFYYKNTTGLSMDLPFKFTSFTFGFDQSFILNEENGDTDEDKTIRGHKYFADTWFMSSELFTSWRIPTGLKPGKFGELVYTPRISGKANYRPGGDIGYARRGPSLTLGHTLGFGKIDWKGNYRTGLEVSIGNDNTFNFNRQTWTKNLIFIATGHLPLAKRFGISGRLQYRHWFDGTHSSAGDVLRGIQNDSLSADYMLSVNLEFPILVKYFLPSKSLYSSKLRIFDGEIFASPFIDLALIKDPKNGREFSFRQILITGGLEVLFFPYFMRSIYIRASAGWNIMEWGVRHSPPAGSNRELFVGFGHFF